MLLRIFLPLSAALLAVNGQQYNRSPYQQQPGQQQFPGYQPNQNFQQQQQQQQNRNQIPQAGQSQQQQQQNRNPQQQTFQQHPNQFNPQNPQQFGTQQNAQGQQQQFNNGQYMQNSRSAISTNPIRMTNTTDMGAMVTIQLRSYSNPSNSLDADTTCACTTYCDFLRANEQNNCQFSFMVVISSADQTVKMIQSDFYPFSQSINQGNWTMPITMSVPTKPSAIDVFVQHLGAVIRRTSMQLLYFNNRLTLVDSFAIPLRNIDPTSGNGRISTNAQSQLQPGSSLSYDLSIQCQPNYLGSDCDLQCGQLGASNGDQVLCRSLVDGMIRSCRYNSARTQVSNCIPCNNYNATSNTCADCSNQNIHAGSLVSHSFRTWTIVLGVLLGLSLLLILCLVIAYIILRNREQEEYDNAPAVFKPPSSNGQQSQPYNNGTNTRTADEWAAPARRPLLHDADEPYRTTITTTTQQRQEHAV